MGSVANMGHGRAASGAGSLPMAVEMLLGGCGASTSQGKPGWNKTRDQSMRLRPRHRAPARHPQYSSRADGIFIACDRFESRFDHAPFALSLPFRSGKARHDARARILIKIRIGGFRAHRSADQVNMVNGRIVAIGIQSVGIPKADRKVKRLTIACIYGGTEFRSDAHRRLFPTESQVPTRDRL